MNIDKETYRLDGSTLRATVLSIEPSDTVRLAVDSSFAVAGTPSSNHQMTAQENTGHDAGFFIRDYLSGSPVGSMACKLGRNLRTAEPLIWKGKIFANQNTRLPDDTYELLSCSEKGKWVCDWLKFEDGQVTPPSWFVSFSDYLGLIMPTLVIEGKLRRPSELCQLFGLRADQNSLSNYAGLVLPVVTDSQQLAIMFFDASMSNDGGISILSAAEIARAEFRGSTVFMGSVDVDTQLVEKTTDIPGWRFESNPTGKPERRVPDAFIIEPGTAA